jgi:hypothetical protein
VLVAVQPFVPGLYLPPVFNSVLPSYPPQTIISPPVQTAVCTSRPEGALVMLVVVQLFVPGLYLPPVLRKTSPLSTPPHTIISIPLQTAVWKNRAAGALAMLVAIQLSMLG